MVVFFAVAFGYFALKPIEPDIAHRIIIRETASVLNAAPVKTRLVQGHDSRTKKIPRISGNALSVIKPEWSKYLSRLPRLDYDEKLQGILGRSQEYDLIRLALAAKLGELGNFLSEIEVRQIESEVGFSMRTAEVQTFQHLEKLALETFSGSPFEKERAAVRELLSQASVENPYARMMIQDLMVREFFKNPNQGFAEVAQQYGIHPDHPFYPVLQSSFDRKPASIEGKKP